MASLRKNNTNTIQSFPEGTLPNSFYKMNVSLIVYPSRSFTRKENYRPITLQNNDFAVIYVYTFGYPYMCTKRFVQEYLWGTISIFKLYFIEV